MNRTCPKCNYVRQPSDEAPEWQCPSCQVAYNKVSGEPASSNYGQPAPVIYHHQDSGFSWLKWIFITVAIAIGAWASKPIWQKSATPAAAATGPQPAVVLYATEWCGYCKATREFFGDNGIQYTELDVEKTTAGYEGHKKLGGHGVPLVVIGDEVIHGYNEAKMHAALQPWLKSGRP